MQLDKITHAVVRTGYGFREGRGRGIPERRSLNSVHSSRADAQAELDKLNGNPTWLSHGESGASFKVYTLSRVRRLAQFYADSDWRDAVLMSTAYD